MLSWFFGCGKPVRKLEGDEEAQSVRACGAMDYTEPETYGRPEPFNP
jgi:hypothetical protein